MDQISRVFIDTSKQTFQLHGVNAVEAVVVCRKLKRHQLLAFFASRPPMTIGLEACGGAHHWARELTKLGHQARLLAPQHVKAYLKRGKNDARDAEAGCEAMSRPTMRFVPVKTEAEQAALMLMGVRDRLVGNRTQLGNEIRGHAAEFGLVAAKGVDKIEPLLEQIAQDEGLPDMARQLFAGLGHEYEALQARLKAIETLMLAWHRRSEASRRLAEIPSVGPIGASLMVMKTPDPAAFKSGRAFAAWLGLTPKDHSTAGRTRLGSITKAGDERLRSVLVSGAMALLQQARRGKKRPWPWLEPLLAKKPKLAAVAIANRVARIAWKLMRTGERYELGYRMAAAA